ncbi:MAG: radical SAM protein [archaeon]
MSRLESEIKKAGNRFKGYYAFYHQKTKLKNKPRIINIELTNSCNSNCIYCPRDKMKRKKGLMKKETLSLILVKYSHLMESVCISHHGESLLHPQIAEFIKMFKDKGVYVTLTTNATILNRNLSEKIILAELDSIVFSIEGIDKKLYEKIRRGSDFEKTKKNVMDFLSLKNKLKSNISVEIRGTDMDLTRPELSKFKKYWGSLPGVNRVHIDSFNSWAGQVDRKAFVKSDYNRGIVGEGETCIQPWFSLIILWDGSVVPCNNYEGAPFGNILNQDLLKIWNNEKYQNLRYNLSKGNKKTLDYCGTCDHKLEGLPLNGKRDKYFPFSLNTLDIIAKYLFKKIK